MEGHVALWAFYACTLSQLVANCAAWYAGMGGAMPFGTERQLNDGFTGMRSGYGAMIADPSRFGSPYALGTGPVHGEPINPVLCCENARWPGLGRETVPYSGPAYANGVAPGFVWRDAASPGLGYPPGYGYDGGMLGTSGLETGAGYAALSGMRYGGIAGQQIGYGDNASAYPGQIAGMAQGLGDPAYLGNPFVSPNRQQMTRSTNENTNTNININNDMGRLRRRRLGRGKFPILGF